MRKRSLIAAGLMVLCMGLTACGSNNETSNNTPGTQDEQTASNGYVFSTDGVDIAIDGNIEDITSKLGEPKGGYYWAVNVCVMSVLGLILNVCGGDGDTTLSLFRSLVDVLEIGSGVARNSCSQNFGNCCGQSGFTMVYVTDGTNITMWFSSLELSFCHFDFLLNR